MSAQLLLPASPLDAAVMASCPASSWALLYDRVTERVPLATATDIDAAARRLNLEQGEPGRYYYYAPPCAGV